MYCYSLIFSKLCVLFIKRSSTMDYLSILRTIIDDTGMQLVNNADFLLLSDYLRGEIFIFDMFSNIQTDAGPGCWYI